MDGADLLRHVIRATGSPPGRALEALARDGRLDLADSILEEASWYRRSNPRRCDYLTRAGASYALGEAGR
jgi:hypothetical protein